MYTNLLDIEIILQPQTERISLFYYSYPTSTFVNSVSLRININCCISKRKTYTRIYNTTSSDTSKHGFLHTSSVGRCVKNGDNAMFEHPTSSTRISERKKNYKRLSKQFIINLKLEHNTRSFDGFIMPLFWSSGTN